MELGLFIFSLFNSCDKSLAWQYTPVIPALRKLRQEDLQLEINLVTWQDPVLKTTRKKKSRARCNGSHLYSQLLRKQRSGGSRSKGWWCMPVVSATQEA
jgi:hypothetical protein